VSCSAAREKVRGRELPTPVLACFWYAGAVQSTWAKLICVGLGALLISQTSCARLWETAKPALSNVRDRAKCVRQDARLSVALIDHNAAREAVNRKRVLADQAAAQIAQGNYTLTDEQARELIIDNRDWLYRIETCLGVGR